MNEIKFRAWDKEFKKMSKVFDFGGLAYYNGIQVCWDDFIAPGCLGTHSRRWGDPYDKKFIEIMQFTGLKDKNDKDIYEGDIIKTTEGGIGKVGFELGSFYCTVDFGTDFYKGVYRYGEVIGNIYEHGNLLNV